MSEREYTKSAIEPIFIELTEVPVSAPDCDHGRRGLFRLDEIKRVYEGAFADQTKVVFEDYVITVSGSYNDLVRKLQKIGAVLC
jgi:hypothetical protein